MGQVFILYPMTNYPATPSLPRVKRLNDLFLPFFQMSRLPKTLGDTRGAQGGTRPPEVRGSISAKCL